MSDKLLIIKYFGQAAPEMLSLAARSLPQAQHVVSRGLAAAKRTPATKPLSDHELIDVMFKNHGKQREGEN